MRRLRWLLLALLVLLTVLAVRTASFRSRQPEVAPAPAWAVDPGALPRLQQALRVATVSYDDPSRIDARAFTDFVALLAASYPRVHASLELAQPGGESLLFTWKGRRPELPPALLAAHFDVVPIEPGTEASWTHPPFAGTVADGFVWGRGTLDDKGSVLGILEAVEALVGEGFQPERTLYLAFGHDEERGGEQGAAKIAEHLKAQGSRLEMVLDEGGAVGEGIGVLPQTSAYLGIAEKGYLTLELSAEDDGGHSSMPPAQTAVGLVATAVARLEADPFPLHLDQPVREMLAFLGPEMGLGRRLIFANLWLFAPLVKRTMAERPSTAAALRTTTAATVISGGVKENVLPTRARALVNFRIRPGETTVSVEARVRRVVGDPRVKIAAAPGSPSEPSPVSRTDSAAFQRLHRTVREVFPGAVAAPYVLMGAADARYYTGLCDNVYRFLPIRVTGEDLARFHNVNERISVAGFEGGIRFYRQLILNLNR
ncbi:MAG TPA: M20 family peptidase [Thermoanaerobaculia bacterium]|nr:M20 family peptidase [Thermoanaerobaculia bacterium]